MYGRKKRINYKRIALLIAAIVVLIMLVSMIFKKNSYIAKVEEALNSKIINIDGSISIVSKIDATVYENDGIKYTNQHEGIKKILTFDGTMSDDLDKAGDAKILLESLLKSSKTEVVNELPAKDDGYYWMEADIVSNKRILFFTKENEYNFDLYYDIENETIYVKEKYFDEFSKKYNKTKFQGYKATAEFMNIIEDITGISGTDL